MGTVCDNCTCGKAEGCGKPQEVEVPGSRQALPLMPEDYKGPRETKFRKDLEFLINCNGRENGSNTPDFILADYLADCLAAYDKAVTARDEWTTPVEVPGWEND